MRDDDSGATMVIVAVSMVALLAMVGLVIDFGLVYAERRELSRGADAAVLAIAADCATGARPCDTATATATAESYVDANSDDGASAIDALTIDLANRRVWARAKSFDPDDGSYETKLAFLRALGLTGATVTAEAAAIWGYPTGGSVLPLVISDCEWYQYAPGGVPDPTRLVTIPFHTSAGDCNAPGGQDWDGDGKLAGGFGWVETGGGCLATVFDGWTVDAEPGLSGPSGCTDAAIKALLYDQTVIVAYFDDFTDKSANNAQYHIAGIGALHITGYRFPGTSFPKNQKCPGTGNSGVCLVGYLTAAELPEDIGDLGGPNRGVVVVRLDG